MTLTAEVNPITSMMFFVYFLNKFLLAFSFRQKISIVSISDTACIHHSLMSTSGLSQRQTYTETSVMFNGKKKTQVEMSYVRGIKVSSASTGVSTFLPFYEDSRNDERNTARRD